MTVKTAISQTIKPVLLEANEILTLSGLNEQIGVTLVFMEPSVDVIVTEVSSTDPALTGVVPLDRLVFNPSQVENEQVALNTTEDKFTTTQEAAVGWYTSAYHDGIKASAKCLVLLHGRKDWRDFA